MTKPVSIQRWFFLAEQLAFVLAISGSPSPSYRIRSEENIYGSLVSPFSKARPLQEVNFEVQPPLLCELQSHWLGSALRPPLWLSKLAEFYVYSDWRRCIQIRWGQRSNK